MKKGIKIGIALIIVIILVIAAVMLVKKRKAEDAHTKTATIYPVKLKAISPKQGDITTTLNYLAIVKNSKNILINSKFAGKIKCIANLGSYVAKGQTIVKIDDTKLKTTLKNINSQMNALKDGIDADKINIETLISNHQRTKQLLKANMASIEQYNMEKAKIAFAKAKLKADESKLNSLQENKKAILNDLTYAIIKSPVNGIISSKFLNKGDNTFPGKPILKIASENGNYLFIPLAKQYKEIIYNNKIYKLIPLHSTFNGIPVYKANVNDKNLIPGEKINIKVVTFHGNATLVPFNTILSINKKNYVFNTNGNPIKVHIIATGNQGVVIKENLGNRLILQANPDILLKIKAGYPVKVINE